jgi:hypothetical protein
MSEYKLTDPRHPAQQPSGPNKFLQLAKLADAARDKISTITDTMIEQQLNSKLKPIQDRIITIGRISECEARIHTGFRSGWVELNTIVRQTKDPAVRQFAQSTLAATAEGYDSTFHASTLLASYSAQLQYPMLTQWLFQTMDENTSVSSLADVVRIINEDQNLNAVAAATLFFRRASGEKSIKMFDFDAVNQWCANHEPQCKPPSPSPK